MADRIAMHGANKFRIGLFGANCSSGRAVTTVPERWSGNWADNLKLAKMADKVGIDFLLPIGRWKGYGGPTDYQGATYETITWACGLLGATERITVFGTVHAPLFPPITAAKQMVTADHIGEGRFGLNIVCGWNEGEFEMFGAQQRDHESRYEYAQEWIDAIKQMWSREEPFDFDGTYIKLKAVKLNPKPYGGNRPVLMNAGASPTGQAFAMRNCDALFVTANLSTVDETTANVRRIKSEARAGGRAFDIYTVGVVTCRPTRDEAQAYYKHCIETAADWGAVDNILRMKNITRENHSPEAFEKARHGFAHGMGGVPLVGTPDDVAGGMIAMYEAGLDGIGLSFVNYLDELPFFVQEVLPRLEAKGMRVKAA
jgi:alkanesulfonate monooxygenase SsuD/methylene tetrahydromethanopterin reductase-like flavin-dependent oxidoreductase (luciferase family)